MIGGVAHTHDRIMFKHASTDFYTGIRETVVVGVYFLFVAMLGLAGRTSKNYNLGKKDQRIKDYNYFKAS